MINLEAPHWTCLGSRPFWVKDWSTVVNHSWVNPWSTDEDSDPLAWTELCRAWIVFVCFCTDAWHPMVVKVTKINIFLAFNLGFCGCFCVLPVLAHTLGNVSNPFSCYEVEYPPGRHIHEWGILRMIFFDWFLIKTVYTRDTCL